MSREAENAEEDYTRYDAIAGEITGQLTIKVLFKTSHTQMNQIAASGIMLSRGSEE
jgi:hypothetical protein